MVSTISTEVLLQRQLDDLWVGTDGRRGKLQDTPAILECLHEQVYLVVLVLMPLVGNV